MVPVQDHMGLDLSGTTLEAPLSLAHLVQRRGQRQHQRQAGPELLRDRQRLPGPRALARRRIRAVGLQLKAE
jgi:hypothetical protein